jgi:hypothetical protein
MAKPASGSSLDTGHALYTSLNNVWAFLEGSGATTADSKSADTGTLNSGSWQSDATGPFWRTTAAAATPITLASAISLGLIGGSTKDPFSIAFGVKKANDSDNQGMVLGDTGNTSDFIWEVPGSYLQYRDSGGGDHTFAGATPFSSYADFLITYDPAANGGAGYIRVYKNAVEVTGSPLTAGNANTALHIITLLNGYTSSAFSFIGDTYYIYIWKSRALTSSDATTLHSNPYVIFQTTTAYSLNAAAGSYAVSGSSATLTLTQTINAASGAYAVTGSNIGVALAISLVASAGSHVITGAAATLTTGLSYFLTIDAGAYGVTGAAATLQPSSAMLNAAAGSYAVSGVAASFTAGAGDASPDVSVVAPTPIRISPGDAITKSPGAQLIYEFNWDGLLPAAVTISSSTFIVTAVRPRGDTALVADNDTIESDNRKTYVRLGAGTPGAEYLITNRIVRAEVPTQTEELSFRLLIGQL